MKNLKNFSNALSRNEMRKVMAGKVGPRHACGGDWCLVQSPAFMCNNGMPPICRLQLCTDSSGLSSTDYVWSCGQG